MYLSKEEALQEIGLAIAPAFPADARFTGAEELTAISVKLDGGRMVLVRLSPAALRKYAVAHPSSRQRGMQMMRSLCEEHLLDPIGKRSGHRIIEAAAALETAVNKGPFEQAVGGG